MGAPDFLTTQERLRGSLLGGAVGDALGAPVEFLSLAEIRRRFGPAGITDYAPAYGRLGAITDDTQMTLFTLEGLIRARVRFRSRGLCAAEAVVFHAYLRWLHTQGVPWAEMRHPAASLEPSGWLVNEAVLHQRRAPGNTCLAALTAGRAGTTTEPVNNSKGCGGVMRAAPVGFLVQGVESAFELGCDVAALTHGHPSGWLPAGVLAATIARIRDGRDLRSALKEAMGFLSARAGSEETVRALEAALALGDRGLPAPQALEALGGGWVAEEALAIAVACAVGAQDFRQGVLAAVNHSGDSDSTGSITGNLLGALHGAAAIPPEWLDALEARSIIETLAADAWREIDNPPVDSEPGIFGDDPIPHGWWQRYPGV